MLLRFEARSLSEALRIARRDAGERAVVVRVERGADERGEPCVTVLASPEPAAAEVERRLKARGIGPSRRRELARGLPQDDRLAWREVAARVERLVGVRPVARPRPSLGGPRVVALVGPTGVGKTTTIAKVAGQEQLERRVRVGLVTLDLYRVAAVDQLRAFADMLGAPLEVAGTAGELRRALDRLQSRDLVLVDTAGRSPRDLARVDELAQVLGRLPEVETLLVLSATTRRRELEDAVARFAPCSPRGLVLTKLDEAVESGDVLELLAHASLPVRLLAHGQEVPDDLELGSAGKLAAWIVDGVYGNATCGNGRDA